MKRTITILLALAMILGLGTTAFAAGEDMEPVKLTLGTVYAADHPASLAIDAAIEEISKASGGKITIEHYPAGQIGDNDELAEQLVAGSVDINVQSLGYFDEKCPEVNVFSCFFVFQDAEHVNKVWEGELGEYFNSMVEENYGVVVLDPWMYGNRVMTTKNTAIHSPEDLKGLKMRVPDHTIYMDCMASFGAQVTPIALTELYMALNQGVVDGQENPVPTIISNKFDEVQGYMCMTNHLVDTIYVMFNQDTWNKLSEEQQEIIATAFKNAGEMNNELIEKQTEEGIEAFKASGGTVVPEEEIDRDAFVECVSGVLENNYPELSDIYEQIQAVK